MGKQYEMAFQIGAKVQGSFGSAFKSAASSVQSLQSTINELNKKQSDIASYQKTQQALEKTREKLKLYEQQYANMKAAIEGNENATYQEQNALLAKGKAIDDLKAKQEGLEKKLETTGQALQEEGVDLNNLGQASDEAKEDVEALRQEQEALAQQSGDTASSIMELVGALGAMEALKAVGQAFKECADQAIAFESSMASVKRTVGGSDNFIDSLGEDFKKLSTEIPITTEELAEIASTAGQLGIQQGKVKQFTEVMAKLATTTDLTADEAATMLAQFANITGVDDYERLGATIAELGDSTATTASKVVQMSQGMAAAASVAGFSPTDIMAISAAVGSLGIEAQAGSTSMSQLISTLYKATETGDKLQDFAAVAGMSAEEFKQSWGRDAVGTMNAFITGLTDVERNGRSAIVILDELGINNVRQQKAILGLANAGDLLTNTIKQANNAWAENTALNQKASIMYETTEAKVTMMQNAFSNVKVAIGDAFTPVIGAAADALTGLLVPVADFIEANPALVQGIGAALAVMGGLTAAVTAYTAAAKIATAVSAALTAAIPGAKLLLAIGAALAVVTGAIVGLSSAFQDGTKSMEEMNAEFDSLSEQYKAEQAVIDLCEQYKNLSSEMQSAVDVSKQMQGFEDIEIKLEGKPNEDIVPEDFLIGGDNKTDITGEANTNELIDGKEFLIEGSDNVELKPKAGSKKIDPEKEMLTTTGVTIQADEEGIIKLDASVFVNDKPVEIKAEWADRTAMMQDIERFKKQASEAKQELEKSQTELNRLQNEKDKLIADIDNAADSTNLGELSEKLGEINAQIFMQNGRVALLKTKYEEAAAQYIITAEAMDTIIARDEELKNLENQIAGRADVTSQAYSREAGSIMETVAAKEALAKAHQAELKLQMETSMQDQAKAYAEAYNEFARQSKRFQKAQEDLLSFDNADDLGTQIAKTYKAIGDALNAGGDWDKGEVLQLRTQFEELYAGMEGINHISFSNYDLMGEALSELDISVEEVTAAQVELGRQMTDADEKMNTASETMKTYIDNAIDMVQTAEMTTDEVRDMMEQSFAEFPNGAQMVEEAMKQIEAAVGGAKDAADDYNEAANDINEEAKQALIAHADEVIGKMNALAESYKNAYEAAYNSINGMFGLFEKAELPQKSEDSSKAVDDMIDSLKSQTDYMEKYAENMKKAADDGLDKGLIAKLSDGSQESAKILADIVEVGEGKIAQLNDAFKKSEEGKKAFADTMAECQTNFSTAMTELEADLNKTVEQMDKSAETAASGARTVDAYAEGALSALPSVEAAFKALSAAAQIKASLTFGFGGVGGFNFGNLGSFFGFAGGTNNAPRGVAMVGEEGPELMYLHGGEQILNTQDTQRVLDNNAMSAEPDSRSGNTIIEFKPQYNITGSMNAQELQGVLEEHDANMRDQLEDMLRDIGTDRYRREYS